MGSQKDVIFSFLDHSFSKFTGFIEIEVFKKSLCKLREAIAVHTFFTLDDW